MSFPASFKPDFSAINIRFRARCFCTAAPDNGDPEEEIAASVENAFEMSENIVLERKYFHYLQWMEGIYGPEAMEAWIKDCDLNRHEWSLADALRWWLYYEDEYREAERLPRPYWCEDELPAMPGSQLIM